MDWVGIKILSTRRSWKTTKKFVPLQDFRRKFCSLHEDLCILSDFETVCVRISIGLYSNSLLCETKYIVLSTSLNAGLELRNIQPTYRDICDIMGFKRRDLYRVPVRHAEPLGHSFHRKMFQYRKLSRCVYLGANS